MAALCDLPTHASGYNGIRKRQTKIKNVVSFLLTHIQDIAKPLGGQQARAGALPFDYRVGDQGGAMHNLAYNSNINALP